MRKGSYSYKELEEINTQREDKYKLNLQEELFVRSFNEHIKQYTPPNISEIIDHQLPVSFIVGLPRSGSSLLYQALTGTNQFNYISNFTSKFWESPYVGLMIEKILGIRNKKEISFTSDFGKTTDGLHSPHEFMYFWDKWFAQGQETQEVPKHLLKKIDKNKFKKEIALIESVLKKPVLFKSQFWLTLQMDFLNETFPNSLFISTKRNPLYIAQSIAIGRKRINGNINKWWSIKPKEYDSLKTLNWAEQVIGQVYYTEKQLVNSLKIIPSHRKVETTYENLCNNPKIVIEEVSHKINKLGGSIDAVTSHLKPFYIKDSQKLADSEFQELVTAYEKFYKNTPKL